MPEFQFRRGTAATWTSVNPILGQGEPGIETDGLSTGAVRVKLGDGSTVWTSLPYCDWNITGGGGGGTGTAAVTALGTLGATFSLPSPSNGDLQAGTLSANAIITPPSAPATGDTLEFDLTLTQNSTGGYTWSFAGSVAYPSGAPIPLSAAGAINWLHLKWNGTSWNVFPVTAGPTVVTGTAIKATGSQAGLGPVEITGEQATGSAPAYTPSSSVADLVWDSALPGLWFSPVGSTTWTSFTGGSTTITGVTVASPQTLDAPFYIAGTGWVGGHLTGFDATALTGGPVAGGSSSQTTALNNAIATISQDGLDTILPAGSYNIDGTVLLSNGNTTGNSGAGQLATWVGRLIGAKPTTGVGKSGKNWPSIGATVLKWTAGNNASFANLNPFCWVQGPTDGWRLENLVFDGNSSYANGPILGLLVEGARNGVLENISFLNVVMGVALQAVSATYSTYSYNCYGNVFRKLGIQYQGGSSAVSGTPITVGNTMKLYANYGVVLSSFGNGNSCYNEFYGLDVVPPASGGATNYSLCLQGCDSNHFYRTTLANSGGQTASLALDFNSSHGTNGGSWPASNTVRDLELGGAVPGVIQINNPAAAAGVLNRILEINQVNGSTPDPFLSYTTWNEDHAKMKVKLSAGSYTFSGSDWLLVYLRGILGSGGVGGGAAYLQCTNIGGGTQTPGACVGVLGGTGGSTTATVTSSNAADDNYVIVRAITG